MKAPKKQKKLTAKNRFQPPVIDFSEDEVKKFLNPPQRVRPMPDGLKDLVRAYGKLRAGQRHHRMADFLASSMQGRDGTAESIFSAKKREDRTDGYILLALRVVGLLLPAFDADEFFIMFCRALPARVLPNFNQGHADRLLQGFCSAGLIRLVRPANSRSAAEYALVRRKTRPRLAR